MKRRVYCREANRDLYEEYYARQNGEEISAFAGSRFQGGHGLGSILGGFFRRLVLQFFKTNAEGMLANAVKTGLEVADDVLGQSFKASAKKRVPAGGIKRTVQNINWQYGSGVKRRRRVKRVVRRTRDIFL